KPARDRHDRVSELVQQDRGKKEHHRGDAQRERRAQCPARVRSGEHRREIPGHEREDENPTWIENEIDSEDTPDTYPAHVGPPCNQRAVRARAIIDEMSETRRWTSQEVAERMSDQFTFCCASGELLRISFVRNAWRSSAARTKRAKSGWAC